jgi:quinol monooxygenase YgiN
MDKKIKIMSTQDKNIEQNAAVTLFVKVAAKNGSVIKAKEALLDDVIGARTEDGNFKMELYQADGQPDTFYLIERWKGQAELEQHFAQPYTKGAFDLQNGDLDEPIEMNYLTDLWPAANDLQKETHRPLTTLIVPFVTKPGRSEEFIRLFEAFVPLVRKEPGNVDFHFLKVNGSDDRFVLYERWENQKAIEGHNRLSTTDEMVRAITPLLTKPVIDFVLFARDIS